jgi:hypothetical protein
VLLPRDGNGQLFVEGHGGIAIALDVLRTIPFAEIAIGAVANSDALEPSVRLSAGGDYLVTRSLSLGIVARYRPLSEALGGDGLLTVALRIAWRIEL